MQEDQKDSFLNESTKLYNSTNTSADDSFQQQVMSYMTYKVAMVLNVYWFPVLVPCGLVGNTISLCVMLKQGMSS